MANFNLADYETVDSRIKRFYTDNPGGRITTELLEHQGDVGKTRWILKASIWRDTEGSAELPDSTGMAFEVDGAGMANRTSALENGETSAIGRALANLGYSGDKRATREEMAKAQAGRQEQHEASVSAALGAFKQAATLEALQEAWEAAGKAGVTGDPRVIKTKDIRKGALS